MSPEVLDRKCPPVLGHNLVMPNKNRGGDGWVVLKHGETNGFLGEYGVYVKEPGGFLFVGFVVFLP